MRKEYRIQKVREGKYRVAAYENRWFKKKFVGYVSLTFLGSTTKEIYIWEENSHCYPLCLGGKEIIEKAYKYLIESESDSVKTP